jgi:serine protease Do
VTRGYLGIGLQPEITSDLAETFNLPDESGAMVAAVTPNRPAAKAGLQRGDVIRELDGKKITDRDQLRLSISQALPGTKVTMKILRSEPGKKPVEKTLTATLDTLPTDLASAGGNHSEQGREEKSSVKPDSLDGVEVSDLDSTTRRQLRIPSDVQGAVVTNVEEDSKAAKAAPVGLREGDVIQEINREPVRSGADAVELSKKAKGNRVLLLVWRDHGSFYVTVDNNSKDTKG